MDSQRQSFDLPPTATHDACAQVHDFLVAARGQPVTLAADKVTRTSTRLALLVATARRQWARDGHPFEVATPSEAFASGLATLGLTSAVLQTEDAQ
ncbi:STAS domain-containing protein [Pelagovum pacificum]|uniref:STAS domain-containing protein n=1 Tax=Pelagovum pacificum TaxID=2588711 RepID=A0A5C5G7H8_9RHOB|nr:STAS domain-containing protein [Pelagovum pacificum]QQA41895.1 STAS domain-containing protein [Pelagovum pacificum]TNY30664.1 STAS domain-containing protein [Pelagovum pacificum]